MDDFSRKIEKLSRMIQDAQRIAGFTGAGVSTESGIPDFRSPGGLWSKYDPSDATFDRFMKYEEVRERYWARHTEMYELMKKASPNPAHLLFARLEEKLLCVITQNIDGLHRKAGVPAEKILELHGTAEAVKCMVCHTNFDREEVHQRVKKGEKAPKCDFCGGPLKPATISFGQPLDSELLNRAFQFAKLCDLMICMGSSLVVQPAASVPVVAHRAGVPLVLINNDPTPLDLLATLLIRGACGEAARRTMGLL